MLKLTLHFEATDHLSLLKEITKVSVTEYIVHRLSQHEHAHTCAMTQPHSIFIALIL